MSIIWTGLAPHPPIMVPAVAGARAREVQATIDSMRALAQDCVSRRPERLVVISPHTPRPSKGIAAWFGKTMQGDFAAFGAPEAGMRLPVDRDWLRKFTQHYQPVADMDNEPLDHGAMAPLHFFIEAGWQGPTVVLGLPWQDGEELDRIGAAVRAACADDRDTAVLASGDMSHCLKPGAPCGYDKRGGLFDQVYVDCLKRALYRDALAIDPSLREAARQDVVESCRVAWAASGFSSDHSRFYSYEGPFGVGYSVMRFYGAEP